MKGKIFFTIIFIVFFSFLSSAQKTVTLKSFIFYYNDIKLEDEKLIIYYSKNKESVYRLGEDDSLLISYEDKIDLLINVFGYSSIFENLNTDIFPFHDDKIEIGYLDISVVRKKISLSEQKNISTTLITTEAGQKCCVFYSPSKRKDLCYFVTPLTRHLFNGIVYLRGGYSTHLYNFVGKKNIDGRKIIRANQKKGNAPNEGNVPKELVK